MSAIVELLYGIQGKRERKRMIVSNIEMQYMSLVKDITKCTGSC
jgi:hypothetical protein